MFLTWFWAVAVIAAAFFSLLTGRGGQCASALLDGAAQGVQLSITMAGPLCLWAGLGKLMDRVGLTDLLSGLLHPILGRLFPESRKDPELSRHLSGNVTANLLGLGNAATPMGIRAAQRLKDPASPHIAKGELCRLIVLNTASIQLIPANVAALRSSLGCATPFDILPAVWITSLCSAGLGERSVSAGESVAP